MSNRHRTRQSGPTSALQEARERRKAEHRRVRRSVNQDLHLAALEEDHDDLVLDLPRPTHGYTTEHAPATPRATGDPQNRTRHWKQPFWKRRNVERQRRAEMYEASLREA